MADLIAVDVAILPPPEVDARARALNAALPSADSKGLRLDDEHLPHITLTQLFVSASELSLLVEQIDEAVRGVAPLSLRVPAARLNGNAVWMTVEPAPRLIELHERLMHALRGVERRAGTTAAFVDGDARISDVKWVTSYRGKASFDAFTPHITLGHAADPPALEPMAFEATTVAACHLGRFCTCRRVLRQWTLTS